DARLAARRVERLRTGGIAAGIDGDERLPVRIGLEADRAQALRDHVFAGAAVDDDFQAHSVQRCIDIPRRCTMLVHLKPTVYVSAALSDRQAKTRGDAHAPAVSRAPPGFRGYPLLGRAGPRSAAHL